MMVTKTSNDLLDNTDNPIILRWIHLVPGLSVDLNGTHGFYKIPQSASTVALSEASSDGSFPQFASSLVGFTGQCQNIPKVSFVIRPAFVAFVARRNSQTLDSRVCLRGRIEIEWEDMLAIGRETFATVRTHRRGWHL
jgi:hypothetical protein